MQYTRQQTEITQLSSSIQEAGVCFDPDNVTLEGVYGDELSAFRARKTWSVTLLNHFLLEEHHDFHLNVERTDGKFRLRCEFLTACARYAFWRLTNSQAPEAQYVIETAHIPSGESQYERFMEAPDLCPMDEGPLIFKGLGLTPQLNSGWFDRVRDLIQRIAKSRDS